MKFGVLGPVEVWNGEQRVAMPAGRQRALLAYLLLNRNTVVSTDRLIDELWPATAPATAAKIVRNLVSELRKLIGGATGIALETEARGYRLRAPAQEVDAARFEELAMQGRHLLERGKADRARVVLIEALQLWRGSPYADVCESPSARSEGARLEELRLLCLEDRFEAELTLGRHVELVSELEAAIDREPFRENVRAQLMVALYRSGRQAEALSAYRDTRRTLVDELGLEPSRRLRELEQAMLAQDPSLDWDGVELGAKVSRVTLPRPASSFVGREREMEEVHALVNDGARLVTLTGPAGSGKTRLAIEAASRLAARFADGVLWVGLAALRDAALVMPTLARALGGADEPAVQIGEQSLLLVLDNTEQVIDAASELANVVEACPNLVVLVTSRELLRVRGETEYAVSPLAAADAVELFCHRAGLSSTEAIATLCRGLDNMPLAVELAAGRTKALSPEQILSRLSRRLDLFKGTRDADPRQQTLRATIGWSYDLLTPEERVRFARLGIFVAGCTVEAADEVADADVDTLQSLVEKNLVRHSGERFSMLETIREYAAERLDASGDAPLVKERFARHLVALANARGAPMFFDRQESALGILEQEHANVRSVIEWAHTSGRHDLVAELFGAYEEVWSARGHLLEAGAWIDSAVAGSESLPPEGKARVLSAAAEVAELTGDLARAVPLYERAIAVSATSDEVDLFWEPACLAQLGRIALARGDVGRARELADRSLELRVAHGLPRARALSVLGEIALRDGDLDRARSLLEEALAGSEQRHAVNDIAYLEALGEVARRTGDAARAQALWEQALRTAVELHAPSVAADCLENLGLLARELGDPPTAARLWRTGQAVRDAVQALRSRPREPGDLEALGIDIVPPRGLSDAVEYALEGSSNAASSGPVT